MSFAAIRMGVLGGVLLVVGGCATGPAPPNLDREQVARTAEDFAESRVDILIKDRSRLLAIEYAITTRAAPRCGELAWSHAGVLLASSDSFEDEVIRKDVEQRFGRDAKTVVAYVVPGSGFDRAGVRIGDRLLRIGDVKLDEADDLTQHLIEHRALRAFDVRYQSGDDEMETRVEFDSACPVAVAPDLTHALTTGRKARLLVDVPIGLSSHVTSDDLLASIVAHEMAHALFDLDDEGPLERERRADREGLLLAARAGFDVSGMPDYWRAVALEYPWLIEGKQEVVANRSRSKDVPVEQRYAFGHDHIGARLPDIRAAVDRIVEQLRQRTAGGGSAAESTAETETSP